MRPDVIVRLPGGKRVVIDAKVPLDAYLRAIEASDEAGRRTLLADHARQVRVHLTLLGHPVVGDRIYGGPDAGLPPRRHALHAAALTFTHPEDGRRITDELERLTNRDHGRAIAARHCTVNRLDTRPLASYAIRSWPPPATARSP